MRPRLLDLFCGAGGCSVGYHRAGFDVVGVDINPQPNYPFEFHQADALALVRDRLAGCWHEASARSALPGRLAACLGHFDAIHASPPCQAFSVATKAWNGRIKRAEHADLIPPTRELLKAIGLPYVIENVPGAPLENPVQLCGSSFGLAVRRHRLFECSFPVMAPGCAHHLQVEPRYPPTRSDRTNLSPVVSVFGAGGGRAKNAVLWAEAMGIDWMTKHGLSQAIPPAYTEHIGHYLMRALTPTQAQPRASETPQ